MALNRMRSYFAQCLSRIHLGFGVGKKSFGVKQIKRKKKNISCPQRTFYKCHFAAAKLVNSDISLGEDRVLEEAEEGAPECMKCGFRTWNDFCPDCG